MYLKKTYICGDVIEVVKTQSFRYGKKCSRSKNKQKSSDEMQAINDRNAAAHLTRILNANFKPGDHHLTLTYRADERPATAEEAKKVLRNFKARLRRLYAAEGAELKYVIVTEYENTAIHHHLIVPYLDLRKISAIWQYGGVHTTSLYEREYSKLAAYLIKETAKTYKKKKFSGHRWEGSKNLVRPKPKVEEVSAAQWAKMPRAKKGYVIDKDSIQTYTSITGAQTQTYRMIKINQPVVHRRR